MCRKRVEGLLLRFTCGDEMSLDQLAPFCTPYQPATASSTGTCIGGTCETSLDDRPTIVCGAPTRRGIKIATSRSNGETAPRLMTSSTNAPLSLGTLCVLTLHLLSS